MSQTPDVVWADGYQKLKSSVSQAEKDLATARRKLDNNRKMASIKCSKCSAEHPISTQEYIQTYWYVRPSGCTGGDYWNSGEANWQCPSCGFKNRFDDEKDKYSFSSNTFYRPDLVALKQFFGRHRECHCQGNRPCESCSAAARKKETQHGAV